MKILKTCTLSKDAIKLIVCLIYVEIFPINGYLKEFLFNGYIL